MQLEMVLASLRDLCDMPIAWAIFAAVAFRALWSVIEFFTCPVVRGASKLDPQAARDKLNARVLHSPRFLTAMLVGIVLSVGGLYALRAPDAGPLALAAIVFGVFILIVEPSRLSVDEVTMRVSAAKLDGADAYSFALDRLRAAHLERIAVEIGMVALLGFVIVSV
ncbi:MAG: hypothetical protein COW75_07575 [Rhodobacterales bacterium CG18_big_fil_WC_8_21_14_2_50_71_9]|nr:MAG: hypothetical protein COW75_07575 [Rhodobacterales bacterium CG18_big_fil_WC_8_21_14_2_50_71_9]PIY74754.1 MAG: hypothetical protein COY86_01500 [Rhodobacterales bacterium CG_4_10_14_0_8_um_filter_70_9]PJA60884.1 MAG: hypothetical protein CO163_01270 [Rhodobacterales bacterium CG_4_9_14_3_um_filter_71_31]